MTSHGFTVKDANEALGSVGTSTAPLFVSLSTALFRVFVFIREGAEIEFNWGSSSSIGEIFLLFREAGLSRESESEATPADWKDCSDSEDEPDASSDMDLVVAESAWDFGAIILGGCVTQSDYLNLDLTDGD